MSAFLADGEGTSPRGAGILRRVFFFIEAHRYEIFAGLSARWIKSSVFLVDGITSMFSLQDSRTMPWIRRPFTPTHTPIGSMWSSALCGNFARSPGMRATARMLMESVWISGYFKFEQTAQESPRMCAIR